MTYTSEGIKKEGIINTKKETQKTIKNVLQFYLGDQGSAKKKVHKGFNQKRSRNTLYLGNKNG